MTDKKQTYEKQLLEAIENNNIKFFDHCFAFVPFSSATAYNHELEKLETIKEALNKNKVAAKNKMLCKWTESENATLQVAAYRLLSTPEEHKLLNQSYLDQTSNGKEISQTTVVFKDFNERSTNSK